MAQSSAAGKLNLSEFIIAGLLAWLIPGAGHFYLGLRKRAVLLFVTIEITFLIGLYIGTIRIVDPAQSVFWFIAQIFAGLNTIISHLWALRLGSPHVDPSHLLIRDWSYHIAVLYTAVAGLLNLLAVFDALIRASGAQPGQATLTDD